jgi:N-acetylglucosamine-6-phosphate deacetylase
LPPEQVQLRCRHYRSRQAYRVDLQGRRASAKADHGALDEPALLIAPTLVDLQVNGYLGLNFSRPGDLTPENLTRIASLLHRHGVGIFFPTVITGSRKEIQESMCLLAASRRDPQLARSMPGFHLEGPYISSEDGPRGAHRREHARPPSWDEFLSWQDAAEGLIRIVTLAPELPGALPFIENLRQAGIVPAIGHTAADTRDIAEAVAAGALLATHLGNGAHAMIRRHPNYIWDQLACDDLWASFIVDGHHLPPNVVKVMLRAKRHEKSILVTDASSVAGLEAGTYQFAGKTVELTSDRVVKLKGTDYLAGAALTLSEAVANVSAFTGIDKATAIDLASLRPKALIEQGAGLSLDLFDGGTFTLLRWDEQGLEVVATAIDHEIRFLDEQAVPATVVSTAQQGASHGLS